MSPVHTDAELGALGLALEGLADGLIVADARDRIRYVNRCAELLTGWASQDVRNQPLAEVVKLIDERTRAPLRDLIERRRAHPGEAVPALLLTRDGREVPIIASVAPLGGGDPASTVLLIRDRTEHKQAARTSSWLAAIVESSDDAIVSKTLDGQIVSWNRGAARLFGYGAEEIVGKPITTIIPPELHPEEREILARLRRGERVDHFDTTRVTKDGRRLQISLTVSPIRDDSGAIVGASKVGRDVTERKQAEQALREADRRKDEFLATLAHELRNPLAPIRTATAIVSRSALAEDARAACDIIERQVRQLTHLVDDLLDMARITAGRVRLQPEPLDVRAAVASAVEAVRPAVDAAQHDLRVVAPPEPVFVRADRVRLPQVFVNILSNAAKYTPPGGRIRVEVERAGGDALVRVTDNGVGIAPAMLEHVFELFTQVDRSYDRTGGGLGIGLTLARNLVEMHGGQIRARSEGTGKGSEFVVQLPVVAAPEAAVPAVPPPAVTPERRRVLIADDNHDAAVSLAMLLQLMGHETRVVYDGAAALELAEDYQPDLVILDIGMPRMNGYETAERMATRPWAAGTRLVALTGWGQEADRRRAIEAGFHRHLVKPVDPDQLRDLLA